MPPTEAEVLDALRHVMDPDLHRDIVSLGFVQDVRIEGGAVAFKVELTTPACPVKETLRSQCEQAVQSLPGVSAVSVEMTARVRPRTLEREDLLPGVKHCIAIASGKGGVGKSTVTVNLAVALAQRGADVGILDADVYGPSVPLMTGSHGFSPSLEEGKIQPVVRFGVKIMSLGYLMSDDQAVLWRGPMVAGTVKQLLTDVDWGDLDYLLVDLPPGTGDASLTLAQSAPLTGVVIVTTPHAIAASIAAKSAMLFRRLEAPILGVVENMGEYACPHCGERSRVFSGMSGSEFAQRLDAPFLGSIPLDPAVGDAMAGGIPSVAHAPQSAQAIEFGAIAERLAAQTSIRAHHQESPDAARFSEV